MVIPVPSMVPVAHRICSKQWPTTLPLLKEPFFLCVFQRTFVLLRLYYSVSDSSSCPQRSIQPLFFFCN